MTFGLTRSERLHVRLGPLGVELLQAELSERSYA